MAREEETVLKISGDGADSEGDNVQGTTLKMGAWSGGKCPWGQRLKKNL